MGGKNWSWSFGRTDAALALVKVERELISWSWNPLSLACTDAVWEELSRVSYY